MSYLRERLKEAADAGESFLVLPQEVKDLVSELEQAEEKIALLTRTIETLVKEQEASGRI